MTIDLKSHFDELKKCCASKKWQNSMFAIGQFQDFAEMKKRSDEIWFSLSKEDWLEAFEAHPKIGDISSLREKYKNTKSWTEDEQSGVGQDEGTLLDLQNYNKKYEDKFGFIFIICATGKSALDMLQNLKTRIENSRDEELKNAALEQSKITKLRLEKIMNELLENKK
jgi:OHCU decarboxylase